MTATFSTADYGTIEVSGGLNKAGVVYFKADDYETTVDEHGFFAGLYGTQFRIMWPIPHMSDSRTTLSVHSWRTIADSQKQGINTSLPA